MSGQYDATAAGAIAEMTFGSASNSAFYELWKSGCNGDSAACLHTGTYAFNESDALVLTDSVAGPGAPLPFSVGATGPGTEALRLLGGGLFAGDAGNLSGGDAGLHLLTGAPVALTFDVAGQGLTSNDSPAAPLVFENPASGTCKHPIVFEHGFAASNEPASPWSFVGVASDLMARGNALVVEDEVEPFGDVVTRAATMAKTIASVAQQCAAILGCDPSGVHVVAHSYGGLHSREYLLEHPPSNAATDNLPPVVSLTTISTPNGGTNVADTALSAIAVGGTLGGQVANALVSMLGRTFTTEELANDSDVTAALHDLSLANASAFLASHPAVPGVAYFAWAGQSVNPNYFEHPVHPEQVTGPFSSDCEGKVFATQTTDGTVHDFATQLVLVPAHEITGTGGEANDGMATITSAKALPGATFMGCIPADHLAETGHAPRSSVNWSGFDYLTFYRNVAANLSQLESQ